MRSMTEGARGRLLDVRVAARSLAPSVALPRATSPVRFATGEERLRAALVRPI